MQQIRIGQEAFNLGKVELDTKLGGFLGKLGERTPLCPAYPLNRFFGFGVESDLLGSALGLCRWLGGATTGGLNDSNGVSFAVVKSDLLHESPLSDKEGRSRGLVGAAPRLLVLCGSEPQQVSSKNLSVRPPLDSLCQLDSGSDFTVADIGQVRSGHTQFSCRRTDCNFPFRFDVGFKIHAPTLAKLSAVCQEYINENTSVAD